jgi:hypothetical protein
VCHCCSASLKSEFTKCQRDTVSLARLSPHVCNTGNQNTSAPNRMEEVGVIIFSPFLLPSARSPHELFPCSPLRCLAVMTRSPMVCGGSDRGPCSSSPWCGGWVSVSQASSWHSGPACPMTGSALLQWQRASSLLGLVR